MSVNIQQQTQTASYEQQLSRTQNLIVAKACLIGGAAFVLICALAFGFYNLVLYRGVNYNTLTLIGTIFLLLSVGVTVFVSFRANLSWGMIALLFSVFIIAISLSFATLFALFDGQTLLMAFGATGGALLLTGVIGFVIKDKTAFKLSRLVMIMLLCYFVFILFSSLLMWFAWGVSNWYFYLINILMGVLVFGTNVLTFYNLRKTAQFLALSEMNKTERNKYVWMQGFSILISIVNTFMFVLRMIAMFSRS